MVTKINYKKNLLVWLLPDKAALDLSDDTLTEEDLEGMQWKAAMKREHSRDVSQGR